MQRYLCSENTVDCLLLYYSYSYAMKASITSTLTAHLCHMYSGSFFFSLISTIKIFILFSLLIFQLMMQNCKCGTCTALPGDGTCSHSFIDLVGYIQSLLLYTRPSIFLIPFSLISDLLDNVFDCRVYTQTAC